jgi:hypothetical protein
MNTISEKDWLKLFKFRNISYDTFVDTFKVKYTQSIKSLKTVSKEKKLNKADLKVLYFYFVTNKKIYLENFYEKSLNIDYDYDLTKIKNLSLSNALNSRYKNIIRNIYYKDLLLYTQTGIKGLRPFLEVILDLFNNRLIDYKLVTPCAISMMKNNIFSSMLSGFYFRSSILNPSVIYTLSKKYLNGTKVFTPTLGWSSYMYGFLSDPKITHYVGTDVLKNVCSNTKKLSKKMFPDKTVDIYCSQSELLGDNKTFMSKYKSFFDIVFFSPPYYKLELYRGAKQSTTLYDDYDTWLEKYWEETIKLCKKVLKKNGTLVYIISGYDKNLDMNKDMNKITKRYFKYKKKYNLSNTNVNFTDHKNANEIIFIFNKT